jgi:hypothetical protein
MPDAVLDWLAVAAGLLGALVLALYFLNWK